MPHSVPRSFRAFRSGPSESRRRSRLVPAFLAAVVVLGHSALAHADSADAPASATTAPLPRPADPDRSASSRPAPFSMGALAGIGFPRPLSLEVLTKLGGYVGLGIEYGILPSLTIAGVNASGWSATVDTRVFPFRGAFFLGLRGGYDRVDGHATVRAFNESAQVDNWMINPRLGFAWTFPSGFIVSTEAGVQVPVSSSFSTSLPEPLAVALRDSTVVRTINGVLPTVDLLRLGMMF